MEVPDPLAALTERIQDELHRHQLGANALSDKTGVSTSDLSRVFKKGSFMETTLKRLQQLAMFEQEFRLRGGDLLREMGFVEDAQTARDVIVSDPSLTVEGREALLVLYEYYSSTKKEAARSAAAKKGPPPTLSAEEEQAIKDFVAGRVSDDEGDDQPPT